MSSSSSDATASVSESRSGNSSATTSILVPSLILIGSQIPLSLIWFWQVAGSREHYFLFPLAFLAVAILLGIRWPRGQTQPFFRSRLAIFLLVVGVITAVCGTLWLSPWFGLASCVAFTGSLLARTNDHGQFGTLISILAPLLVLVPPPTGIDFDTVQGDVQLMSWVNTSATAVAQDIFDVLNLPYLEWDVVNVVYGSNMQVEHGYLDSIDSGAGGFSVFSLLVFVAIYVAIRRRPVFRGIVLLVACVFWAIAGESLELMIRAVSSASFGLEGLSGPAPLWIRLVTFLFAFVMTIMTDHFLSFLFGHVDSTAIDEDAKFQYWLCRYWNRYIAGHESEVFDQHVKHEVAWSRWRNARTSRTLSTALWVAAIGCAVMAAFQIIGMGRASARVEGYALEKGNGDWIQLAGSALPESLADCSLVNVETVVPEKKTAFRVYETIWTYADPDHADVNYSVNVSQAWPGWHDAVADQVRDQWTPDASELAHPRVGLDGIPDVPVYEADFHNTLAEFNYLVYCELDGFGEPFEAPLTWRNPVNFWQRAVHRVRNPLRPRLFRPESIVVQVSVLTIGQVSDEVRERARRVLAEAAAAIRAAIVANELPVAGSGGS